MRTIAQIYEEIVGYKDSQAPINSLAPTADTEQELLADLNSTSKVAIWRLWAYITAVAIFTHESLWEIFNAEVQAIADAAIVGTTQWYQDMVFKFQYGDTLEYDSATGKYGYATIDENAKIVKRCAVVEGQDGVLGFKVAKLDSGVPTAMTNDEQDALALYLKKVRFAGTKFTVLSGEGDVLRVEATIYYDGVVSLATITAAVQDAITAYVGSLPFNGQFLLSALTDAIQAVDGVEDVVLDSIETKSVPSDPYVAIDRIHVPLYGYYRIDDTAGDTLDDTLTFIAQ